MAAHEYQALRGIYFKGAEQATYHPNVNSPGANYLNLAPHLDNTPTLLPAYNHRNDQRSLPNPSALGTPSSKATDEAGRAIMAAIIRYRDL